MTKLIFQSSVEIPKDQQNEFLSHQQNGTEENKTKHLSLQNRSTTDDKVIVNNSLITSSSHPTILISPRNKQATQNNKKEENTIEYTTTKISENTETKTEQISSKIIRTSNPEINSPNTLSPRENETTNSSNEAKNQRSLALSVPNNNNIISKKPEIQLKSSKPTQPPLLTDRNQTIFNILKNEKINIRPSVISPRSHNLGSENSNVTIFEKYNLNINNNNIIESQPQFYVNTPLCGENDWKEIFKLSSSVNVKKNEVVVRRGEKNEFLYRILSGRIIMLDENSSAMGVLIDLDVYGEFSLLSNDDVLHRCDLIALTPLVLQYIPINKAKGIYFYLFLFIFIYFYLFFLFLFLLFLIIFIIKIFFYFFYLFLFFVCKKDFFEVYTLLATKFYWSIATQQVQRMVEIFTTGQNFKNTFVIEKKHKKSLVCPTNEESVDESTIKEFQCTFKKKNSK